MVNGIRGGIGAVGDAVSSIADTMTSFLHFSVPDQGSLTQYQSWMPDFMSGLAQGIKDNKSLVTDAVSGLSTDMSVSMNLKTPTTANVKQPQLTFFQKSTGSKTETASNNNTDSKNDLKDTIKQAFIEAVEKLKKDESSSKAVVTTDAVAKQKEMDSVKAQIVQLTTENVQLKQRLTTIQNTAAVQNEAKQL